MFFRTLRAEQMKLRHSPVWLAFSLLLALIVSIRFGRGASIGLGIVESLLSALFFTGLGDGRWQFIPCARALYFARRRR